MKQNTEGIRKNSVIILIGILFSGLATFGMYLQQKEGGAPWFALLSIFIINAGLHINLLLKGYKRVNLDRYTYSSLIFTAGFLVFMYLSVLVVPLILINFIWFLWIIIYLRIISIFYRIEKAAFAMLLSAAGVFLSYYTTIGFDYFNLGIIAFFFSTSITILYPLLISRTTNTSNQRINP